MNNIENNIIMSDTTDISQLLSHMGPARSNMGVVEPVHMPIFPAPPNMVFRVCFN